jgi:hypothetical protein
MGSASKSFQTDLARDEQQLALCLLGRFLLLWLSLSSKERQLHQPVVAHLEVIRAEVMSS